MIEVYTGDGKGKTTAALGLALRALGHGFRVLCIQFMKGDPKYGEVIISKKLPNFEIIQSGLPTFVKKGDPSCEDLRLAKEGFEKAKEAIKNGKYDMVILDEINVAMDYGLIEVRDVEKLIRECPENIELILTGRYAPKRILELADLVSEVREIKHYYKRGVKAREGIEY